MLILATWRFSYDVLNGHFYWCNFFTLHRASGQSKHIRIYLETYFFWPINLWWPGIFSFRCWCTPVSLLEIYNRTGLLKTLFKVGDFSLNLPLYLHVFLSNLLSYWILFTSTIYCNNFSRWIFKNEEIDLCTILCRILK